MNYDLRIMYYNIYGYIKYFDKENHPNLYTGPIALRQENEMTLIRRYAPDILGMQEYCSAFHQDMTPLLEEAGYAQIDVWHEELDRKGNRINFTPLFYRKDRVIPLDFGFLLYDGPNDVNSKSMTWAVFETVKDKKRFIVVCTHFMYNDPKLPEGGPNAARISNAKQLLDMLEEISRRKAGIYAGLPVIIGGDLNCKHGSDPFQLLYDSNLKWLYEEAEITNESCGMKGYAVYDELQGSYITCPVPGDNPYGSIDHMWLRQGAAHQEQVKVLEYATVKDKEACLSSDHCPRYADILIDRGKA